MTKILSHIDFRLLDASLELHALEDHLQRIESHMKDFQETKRRKIETQIREEGLCSDDPEWHIAWQGYDYCIDQLPRFFRGPFLVILYAVYESIVTEISRLIQTKQSQKIAINDLRGDFLERAKKYYKHILQFELYSEEEIWEQVKMLSELRNAFAHANGRLDILNEKSKKKIEEWSQQNIGISTDSYYVVCEENIVAEIFGVVSGALEDLIERYKHWDDQHRHTC